MTALSMDWRWIDRNSCPVIDFLFLIRRLRQSHGRRRLAHHACQCRTTDFVCAGRWPHGCAVCTVMIRIIVLLNRMNRCSNRCVACSWHSTHTHKTHSLDVNRVRRSNVICIPFESDRVGRNYLSFFCFVLFCFPLSAHRLCLRPYMWMCFSIWINPAKNKQFYGLFFFPHLDIVFLAHSGQTSKRRKKQQQQIHKTLKMSRFIVRMSCTRKHAISTWLVARCSLLQHKLNDWVTKLPTHTHTHGARTHGETE